LITIPNSTITSASINNQGAPSVRRHSLNLALGRDLPVDQIAAARDRLHAWLKSYPAVEPEDTEVAVELNRETGAELKVNFTLREVSSSSALPSRKHEGKKSLNGSVAAGVGAVSATDETSARQEITYTVLRIVQALRRSNTAENKELLRAG
jgi:small-conductance mechanosensitive channel